MRHLFLCTTLALMPSPAANSTAPTPPNVEIPGIGKVALPSTSTGTSASAAQAVNAFGVDVLNKSVPAGNALVSPYSIQAALTMAYTGASGETRKQMARTLRHGDDAVASFAALSRELNPSSNSKVTLAIANRLFAQKGYEFRPEYLAAVKRDFGAPTEQVDFKRSPAAAAKLINAWVEKQTRNRIRDLISPNDLSEDTRLVLANAVYFYAPWAKAYTFDKKDTHPKPFTMLDATTRDAPMMHLTERMPFYEAANFIAVALPYVGGDFRFVAILPKGDFEKFSLTAETLKQLEQMQYTKVALSIPKFRLEPPVLGLSDFLKAAGMPSAFNVPQGSADFSGIAPRKPDAYLYISAVFHKAFLDVSEKGTEAAAATAVVVSLAFSAAPPPEVPRVVNLDRPFYFAIQHAETGACLFLGRLVEP